MYIAFWPFEFVVCNVKNGIIKLFEPDRRINSEFATETPESFQYTTHYNALSFCNFFWDEYLNKLARHI